MTSGCILYTGPINHQPSVDIEVPAGTLARGQMVTIGASGRDPDGDPIGYHWLAIPCACALAPDPHAAIDEFSGPPPFTLQLPAEPDCVPADSVCVWVTVTDSHGAISAPVSAEIVATNQPPTAVIDVQQPAPNGFGRYDLYSVFRLSAARSSDPNGDAIVSRLWSLDGFPHAASGTSLYDCAATSPQDVQECLNVGAVPGAYTVSLQVSDGTDDSSANVTLTVDPDHPPCISQTVPATDASPIVLDPMQEKTLAVSSVIDDGSPYPQPAHVPPTFTWSLRVDGGAWQEVAGFGEPSLTLPADSYVSGDHVDVQAAVSDGVTDHPLATCDPRCQLGCVDTVVWSLEYR